MSPTGRLSLKLSVILIPIIMFCSTIVVLKINNLSAIKFIVMSPTNTTLTTKINKNIDFLDINHPIHNLRTAYIEDNYTFFCDFHPKKTKLFLSTNHKTGTRLLSNVIFKEIFSHYSQKCNNKTWKGWGFDKSIHVNSTEIKKWIQELEINNFKNSNKYWIILNMIRDPIDTVLSGYNYHKITSEPWVRPKISNLRQFDDLCIKMINFIRKYYPFYMDKSIKNIYLTEPLIKGIETEFYRYQICVFNRINTSYHIINDELIPKYINDKTKGFANLKMEYDYNNMLQSIFDILGIFDIMDRKQILNKLKNVQSKVGHTKNNHVTSGTYNKTKQIHALLNDNDKCIVMKQDTLYLNYDWKYNQYC